MVSLVRDWLLDPTAIQFLISLLFVVILIWQACRRSSQRSNSPRRHRRKSRRPGIGWLFAGLLIWVALYLFSSAPVVVNPLIATLENAHPADIACPAGSHLVVLGGGVDSRIRTASEFGRMSKATLARATSAANLANEDGSGTVIVAGGALKDIAEADVIAAYLQQMGIDENRIVRESRSSNTRENALNVAQLLQEETVAGAVRLVTSAMHMSRALGSFRKALDGTGITVCPVSVDIQALYNVPVYAWMPQTSAVNKFDLWFHEIAALIHYRIKGWV